MCYSSKLKQEDQNIQNRFAAIIDDSIEHGIQGEFNAFEQPFTPIISNDESHKIKLAKWRLLPFGVDLNNFKAMTYNARIDTINSLSSYKPYVQNRCLIIVDGFYEHKWMDVKGKRKEKYLLTLPDQNAFAFAGIYSDWQDKTTNKTIRTYTVITTEANELMSEIHNSGKRMPVILTKENEQDWLKGINSNEFSDCSNIELNATLQPSQKKSNENNNLPSLFPDF